MAERYIWILRDILNYLDEHGLAVIVRAGGETSLKYTLGKDAEVEAVRPHLVARKAELVAYFTGELTTVEVIDHKTRQEARLEERRRIARLALVEAAESGQVAYLLLTTGKERGLVYRWKGGKLPEEAGAIAIGEQWKPLPMPIPNGG